MLDKKIAISVILNNIVNYIEAQSNCVVGTGIG